ncbi:unnamed protein product [Dicrocoelium dendriticum]|nr:unnamed protein product [Dicrocoelium dendriticum]
MSTKRGISGVIVSPDLKSMEDTRKRVASAYRIIHAIQRAFSRLTPALLLFASHVRPVLEYGLPAAYPLTKSERDMIEKVQRRGSKSFPELWDLSPTGLTVEPVPFGLSSSPRRSDIHSVYSTR